MFCDNFICPITKNVVYYSLRYDASHHQNKKELEINDDAPAKNIASSTNDVADNENSDAYNLPFTGVWLLQVANNTPLGENSVSITEFNEVILGDDDTSTSKLAVIPQISSMTVSIPTFAVVNKTTVE